ncbi:hypothetical protein Pf1_02276 [Flavobacterium columnare]|nr:hypothetical protein Pf1_02276 [Flavobacterium columnare]
MYQLIFIYEKNKITPPLFKKPLLKKAMAFLFLNYSFF